MWGARDCIGLAVLQTYIDQRWVIEIAWQSKDTLNVIVFLGTEYANLDPWSVRTKMAFFDLDVIAVLLGEVCHGDHQEFTISVNCDDGLVSTCRCR